MEGTGYRRHARIHTKRGLDLLAKNITRFGFVVPILIDVTGAIIAGHARVSAAKRLGYQELPALRLEHLSPIEVRALRLADNRLAELSEWNKEVLAIELKDLIEFDFDVSLSGFESPQVDILLNQQFPVIGSTAADDMPPVQPGAPVTRLRDLWVLDEHRVLCGDACNSDHYQGLLGEVRPHAMFADAPYNIPVDGTISGAGRIKHREFVQGSGEMSAAEYAAFISRFVASATGYTADGSVHFHCIDWRQLCLYEQACKPHYAAHLNTITWVKPNAGMGSLYRSQSEFVLAFRSGQSRHTNNIELGRHGRNRSNVWFYEGCNSINPARRRELLLHPTPKPVEMIADAIRDVTHRGQSVLDPFLGSGSTLIACEKTERACFGIELDPLYVDVIVRRWQEHTGRKARHLNTGLTFDQTAESRGTVRLLPPPPLKTAEA